MNNTMGVSPDTQAPNEDRKKYNFISGLPRSGSTLLSSILNQNPRFTAGITDTLHEYSLSIIRESEKMVGLRVSVSVEKRKEIIRGIFDSFYSDGNDVCFNTNRAWTSDTYLLHDLFPDFKMIVMVRDVRDILNSFERLHAENPYTLKPIYSFMDTSSVYDRCDILLGNTDQPGAIAGPLNNLKNSFASPYKDNILYVPYGILVAHPKETMQSIYEFLEEEWFEHDFNNVGASYEDFDADTKINGLHNVRDVVQLKQQMRFIPDDIWERAKSYNIWDQIDKSQYNWLQVINS